MIIEIQKNNIYEKARKFIAEFEDLAYVESVVIKDTFGNKSKLKYCFKIAINKIKFDFDIELFDVIFNEKQKTIETSDGYSIKSEEFYKFFYEQLLYILNTGEYKIKKIF